MKFIGIAGKKGSGKTTLADRLVAPQFHYRFSFADPIRDACSVLFDDLCINDLALDWMATDKKAIIPSLGKSRRHIEQTLGTEWGRQLIHPEIWVILMRARLLSFVKSYPMTKLIVIDDVRFEDEAAFIRSMGGTIIHLHRPSLQEVDPHASEAGIKFYECDEVLENVGDILTMHKLIEAIVHNAKSSNILSGA